MRIRAAIRFDSLRNFFSDHRLRPSPCFPFPRHPIRKPAPAGPAKQVRPRAASTHSFSHQPHLHADHALSSGIRRLTHFHREESEIVRNFSAANLQLRCSARRFTLNGWTSRSSWQQGRLARLTQEHETLHKRNARRRRQAGKCICIPCGEKFGERLLTLRTSSNQGISQRSSWRIGLLW